MTEQKVNSCPEFPHFGAHYPDAVCIDGYLWDLDSSESDGMLHKGGDDPCPFCNTEEYVEWLSDEEMSREDVLKDVLKYIEQLRKKYQ